MSAERTRCLTNGDTVTPVVTLRPATIADVPVLRSWDEQPHVISATGDDDNVDWDVELSRNASWQWNLIAESDGRPIGVIQIIDPVLEESHYWGAVDSNLRALDIWIGPPDDLGRGYGTTMMCKAIDFCFADPRVDGILIDPLRTNTRARRFYERLGFQLIEYRTFGTDDCAVYRLDR